MQLWTYKNIFTIGVYTGCFVSVLFFLTSFIMIAPLQIFLNKYTFIFGFIQIQMYLFNIVLNIKIYLPLLWRKKVPQKRTFQSFREKRGITISLFIIFVGKLKTYIKRKLQCIFILPTTCYQHRNTIYTLHLKRW